MSDDGTDGGPNWGLVANLVPLGLALAFAVLSEPFLLDGEYAIGGALLGLAVLCGLGWLVLR